MPVPNFFLKRVAMKRFLQLFFLILLNLKLECRLISYKTIPEFIKEYPETKWIKCTQNYAFDYPEFPLYPEYKEKYFPNQGYHSDISIIEVPNAIASIHSSGYVFVNDIFLKETQVKNLEPFAGKENITQPEFSKIVKVSGRLAIINHLFSPIYGLFINDILTALALLELYNVEYDYLCIPCNQSYQLEALNIWGIDQSKIIPLQHGQVLEADTIIIPTSVTQNTKLVFNVNYIPDFLVTYVREKMLTNVKKMNVKMDFPEKIFISRKDASYSRKVPNEDEIFKLFEPLGYQRLEFTKLSMAQKIAVTNHAKSIINFLGSGSTNILFASPDVKYYEIQQQMVEPTFYYIAKTLGLHYECLDATSVTDLNNPPFLQGRYLSLDIVKNFIKNHPEL